MLPNTGISNINIINKADIDPMPIFHPFQVHSVEKSYEKLKLPWWFTNFCRQPNVVSPLFRITSNGVKAKAESLFNFGSAGISGKNLSKTKRTPIAGSGHVASTFSVRRG